MKKTVIIATVAILAVLAVLAGVILSRNFQSKPTYEAHILNAQKYFDAGRYDDAILEYQKAIEMDENREDAYIGLADLYYHQGLVSLARRTLEDGMTRTGGGEGLEDRLAIYFPGSSSSPSGEGGEDGDAKPVNSAELGLNTELLQFLSGATYNDYLNRYDHVTASMSGDRCIVRASGLAADVVFYDTSTSQAINRSTGAPYSESIPNAIEFDDVCVIFGGVSRVEYRSLETMLAITNLTRSNGQVQFQAGGCNFSITCDENGAIHSGAANSVEPTGVVTITTTHKLHGIVVDASTGSPLAGAELRFRAGYSYTVETRTDSGGRYEINVAETGSYTVTVTMSGYIDESFEIYVPDASAELSNDFTISPVLSEDEIRIVLTWGAFPSDLDSHLHGTMDDGSSLWVYYAQKQGYNSSSHLVAELDVDDTDSYGPETITIHDTNGVFYFSVEDYTRSTGVGTSGATVKIYKGNTLVETFTPESGVGLGWDVCKIDHGVITMIDSGVGM